MIKRKQKINARLTIKEKKELDTLAKEWGLSLANILRRLILIFVQGKISVIDLIRKIENIDSNEDFLSIQVTLTDAEKQHFLDAIKEWDFSANAILRRLTRALLTGVIPKSDLW